MTGTRTRIAIHALFVAAVLIGGSLIAMATGPGDWYRTIAKPAFNPPNWLFGPVWTLLYIMIGIAGARTWLDRRGSTAAYAWAGQMTFNFLWSPAFFGLQSPLLGLMVIVPMLASILAFIATSWNSDRISALLFVPYALWVGFATVLNAAIFVLNR